MFKRSKHWLGMGILGAGALGFAGLAAAGAPPNGTGPFNAQHPMTMNDVGFTGPLEAPNARTIPKGHWVIEPYLTDTIDYGEYSHSGSFSSTPNTNVFLNATLFQYGVTNRFNISIIPILWSAHLPSSQTPPGQSSSSNGLRIGPTTLRFQYNLIPFTHLNNIVPIVSIAAAESLPTGQYDGADTIADTLVPSGIWSTDLGFWTENYWRLPNGHLARSRFTLDYIFPDAPSSVNGISKYGTATANFHGQVHGGTTLKVDASFEYALTTTWIPVLEVLYTYNNGGNVKGVTYDTFSSGGLPIVTTPYKSFNGVSQTLEVDPALEFMFNQNIGLIAGVQVSVWGQNASAYVVPQVALDMFF